MKKWMVIVALLVLVAACGQTGKRVDNANYRTGGEGVFFTLGTNLPPARAYDDQRLDVLVELENRGATDIGGAGDRVYLSGFDPRIITGIPYNGQQIPAMAGKDQYGPGDKAFVSFSGVPVSLTLLNIDKYTPRLQVTACYTYESIGTGNVCIDPDPHNINSRDKVCEPHNVGLGTQGGPIAINTIEVNPSPGVTRFEFVVQNVGRGQPFRSGVQYLQKCSPNDAGLAYNEVDYVEVVDVNIAGISIKNSCRPLDQGHLRLQNGGGRIFCTFDHVPGSAAYVTPVTVRLRYGYRETIERDITLIQSGR